MGKHVSNESRRKLVEMVFDMNFELKDAARALAINYKTASRICREFLQQERTDRLKPTGRKVTFNRDYERKVVKYFTQFPDATLAACKNWVLAERDSDSSIVPSIATIDRLLAKSKISFKTLSIVPEQRNSETTIELGKEFAIRFTRYETNGANFVYLDEFGCKMSLRRNKGQSRIGTAATISTPGKRGNNLSVCAAIDLNGPIHYLAKFHSFNQEHYQTFLRELSAKLNRNHRNVLIMDNASFHKTIAVRELIKKELKLDVLYLPP